MLSKNGLLILSAFLIAFAMGGALVAGVSGEWTAWYQRVSHAVNLMASADATGIRAYLLGFGAWAPAISAALMITQAIIAPLPASVITIANGLVFGAWKGGLLSWSTALLAAIISFAIPRILGRPAAEKLAGKTKLERVDAFFARFGRHAILIGRLMPIMPFDVVSYAAGLTKMRTWDFLVATGLGLIPSTIIYSLLGYSTTASARWLLWGLLAVACVASTVWAAKAYLNNRARE